MSLLQGSSGFGLPLTSIVISWLKASHVWVPHGMLSPIGVLRLILLFSVDKWPKSKASKFTWNLESHTCLFQSSSRNMSVFITSLPRTYVYFILCFSSNGSVDKPRCLQDHCPILSLDKLGFFFELNWPMWGARTIPKPFNFRLGVVLTETHRNRNQVIEEFNASKPFELHIPSNWRHWSYCMLHLPTQTMHKVSGKIPQNDHTFAGLILPVCVIQSSWYPPTN